ncbi:MAG: phosphatase PAP2 family protein [Anaerolineales bacterium]|nr:phosphatase PAP2 family protein [Anaerolineales bacterium]
MQNLIEIGVAFIIALQGAGDWLILPMRFFSYLGTEEFYLLVLPFIYWSVDSALGLRVGFILMTSNLFNYAGKLLFAGPRPYWVSSHVRGLWAETSFGVPSGHAQLAVSVWGMIAAYLKKNWAWIVAVLLMFFIGFSRLYLGAHFPHDVVFGWLLGALILWAFVRFWEPVQNWVGGKTLKEQVLIAFVVSLVFIAVGFGAATFRSGYQIPQTWMENALLADAAEPPAPVDANSPFTAAGVFFGMAVGAAWIESLGGYSAAGTTQQRALRYVIGLIGVLVFYMGLGAIFPRGNGLIFYLLRYVRYALVGWWISGGAPRLFKRFNLAD